MRSDYALYAVAIIFFAITGVVLVYRSQVEFTEVWVVTTAVLGLLFIGLGYFQKPKAKAIKSPILPAVTAPPPPPAPVKIQEERVAVEKPTQLKTELTTVKGIGQKRAEQLKALGIDSAEKLVEASAKDLAAKLKISQKITKQWIERAKELIAKP